MDNKYEDFILGLLCLDWGPLAYEIIKTELKELLSILIAICRKSSCIVTISSQELDHPHLLGLFAKHLQHRLHSLTSTVLCVLP